MQTLLENFTRLVYFHGRPFKNLQAFVPKFKTEKEQQLVHSENITFLVPHEVESL